MTRFRQCMWPVGLMLLLPAAGGPAQAQGPEEGWQVYTNANRINDLGAWDDAEPLSPLATAQHIEYTGLAGSYYIYIYTASGYNNANPYTLRVVY